MSYLVAHRTRTSRLFASLAALAAIGCGGDPGSTGSSEDVGRSRDSSPDRGNDSDSTETTLLPPIAVAGEDVSGSAGRPMTFDGTASSDSDGTIEAWVWNMGNGATLEGDRVTYTFPDPGVFEVTLTVTDDDGLSASDSLLVDLVEFNEAPNASIYGPTRVVMGEENEWNADNSSDDIGIATWEWSTGVEGSDVVSGGTLLYAYPEHGIYTLSLTVTDTDGIEDTDSREVTVLAPPIAVMDAPVSGFETMSLHFDGSESHDVDGTVVGWHWDFEDGSTSTGPFADHVFALPGDYDVVLTVTDDDDLIGSTSFKVSISPLDNLPPIADAAASPLSALTGEPIQFSGEASLDYDGTIAEWEWDFGDGESLPGEIVSHSYGADGVYVVTLLVTDNEGATATDSIELTVGNRPPLASFDATGVLAAGRTTAFDASASSDPDGSVVEYRWDFGDGATAVTASSATGHVYAARGVYAVGLIVADDDGAPSARTERIVEVLSPPVAVIDSDSIGYINEALSFSGAASSDEDGTVQRWDWTWGDGTTGSGVTRTHAFTTPGSYDVTLTVTDDDGLTGVITRTVDINVRGNVPPTAVADAIPSAGLTNEEFQFAGDLSFDTDGTITSWRWDFGDGGIGAGALVTHSYDDDGTYLVNLRVTDDDGATGNASLNVTVGNREPMAAFDNDARIDVNRPGGFDASASTDPDGFLANYHWDFGDGSTSDRASPVTTHVFASPGLYTVSLVVTDDNGADSSRPAERLIRVVAPPIAVISAPVTAVAGDSVNFDGAGSSDDDGSIVSYAWDFGDGANGTGAARSHVYASAGTFTATLTVTDNDGYIGSDSHSIAISPRPNDAPVAVASANPTDTLTQTSVQFVGDASSDSDGSIVSWRWDFGDGEIAMGAIVSHSYSDDGTYLAELRVTDDDGATDTATLLIVVGNRVPSASFTVSSPTDLGDSLVFNASSSGDLDGTILQYNWDFGDGTSFSTPLASTTHVFSTPGPTTVTLTVTDDDGLDSEPEIRALRILTAPIADIDAASNATVGDSVLFSGTGSSDPDGGTIVSWAWDFDDGGTGAGSSRSHTFASAGTYTVTLTVTDNDGYTDVATHIVVVAAVPNLPPNAVATANPTTTLTNTSIQFVGDNSTDADGTVVAWRWDFGDGQVTTGAIVNHAYSDDGTYLAELRVTDDDGATDTATVIMTIGNRSPVASFTNPARIDASVAATFNASTSSDPDGTIVDYHWDFGDGTEYSTPLASTDHTYSDPGSHTVTLVVTDDDGATSAEFSRTIRAITPPVAVITAPDFGVEGVAVGISGASSYELDGGTIVSWAWDFDDGTTGSGSSLSHVFNDPGNFDILLTVTDNDGLTGQVIFKITIDPAPNIPPTATFTAAPNPATVGQTVTFNGAASSDPDGTIVNYRWDYGDGTGNLSGPASVTHAYAAAGSYVATLIVTDDDGASDDYQITVTVSASAPDYDGTWTLNTPISHSCSVFSIPVITVNFNRFILGDNAHTTVSAEPQLAPTGQPCLMSGTWSSSTDFTAQCTIPGSCNETYRIDGTITGPNAMNFTYRHTLSGSCFSCAAVTRNGTATRP